MSPQGLPGFWEHPGRLGALADESWSALEPFGAFLVPVCGIFGVVGWCCCLFMFVFYLYLVFFFFFGGGAAVWACSLCWCKGVCKDTRFSLSWA